MIYSIAIFVSFFLALIIFTKKGRNLADVILGIWLIFIGLHCTLFYISYTDKIFEMPHLLGTGIFFPFLHGPMLYLYTEALTNPQKFKTKQWMYHFILPSMAILIFSPFYMSSVQEKILVFQQRGKGYEVQLTFFDWALAFSGIFYVVFTYLLLHKHKKAILNQFSYQEKINLDWLRFLFYGMTVMWFIIIFIGGDNNIFPFATIFIFLIGYFGIKQTGIFTNQREESKVFVEEIVEEKSTEKKKYAKSGLNEDTAKELHQKLTDLVSSEKIYLNPELTLADLASRLEVHSNYLSQVINENEGATFYDYINTLRIEEFKRLVQVPENQRFTLLALAFDCGFNSKTSFNRNFKKITNLSPSEYLKQLNIKLD